MKTKRIATITIDLEIPDHGDPETEETAEAVNKALDIIQLSTILIRTARHELGQYGGPLAGVIATNRHE